MNSNAHIAQSVLRVANTFLKIASEAGYSLDHLKLQKLVYFAHGWYLANYDKPLIANRIEAWQHGPVIPELYAAFKQFKNGPITREAVTSRNSVSDEGKFVELSETVENEEIRDFLKVIWDTYGSYESLALSNFTHADDSPWAQARAGTSGPSTIVLDDKSIGAYFKALAQK